MDGPKPKRFLACKTNEPQSVGRYDSPHPNRLTGFCLNAIFERFDLLSLPGLVPKVFNWWWKKKLQYRDG
jgi:hypothetical protein